MSDTSPRTKNLRWFIAGCVFTALVFLKFFKPKLDRISQTQDTGMASTIGLLRSQQAELIKERDTCNAKFERATVLYDVGFFNNETRAWIIPADVDPVLASSKSGTYSHYDPKTQTETVHIKGKTATQ